MFNCHLITIFPEFFASPLQTGLLGKAIANGILNIDFRNPRTYAENKHRHVDDAPYGGGPGMVMRAEPIARAIDSIANPGRLIMLTPSGRPLAGQLARQLADEQNITLVCGRYEGIDARLAADLPIEEISVGNAILNGGETAALAVLESVARFLPGFLGSSESAEEESLANGLLEYPQYTRPAVWHSREVPKILRNGNHAAIGAWRRDMALARTAEMRPDLLPAAPLCENDIKILSRIITNRIGRNLSFCLVHHPVRLDSGRVGTSSLTNLDVHDIARISHSYGMGPFYVYTPLRDQLDLLKRLLDHWLNGPDCDRAKALSLVRPAASFEEVLEKTAEYYGRRPFILGSSAQWRKDRKQPFPMTPEDIRKKCSQMPVLALLGTAHGLDWQILKRCDAVIRPLRFLNENHLSVRSAAAIIADRILGDFN